MAWTCCVLLQVFTWISVWGYEFSRTLQVNVSELRPVPFTDEQKLLQQLMHNYDPAVRPVFDASHAVTIELGITLTQVIDVDEKNQVLTTNVWLDQMWTDEKLKWNTSEHNISVIRIPCDLIWLPDIVLYNSVDNHNKGYMRSLAMVHSDGKVFWPPIVRMRSSCKMDITFFPFDDQLCGLVLGSWAYDGTQLDVWNNSLNVDLSNYVDNGEWILMDTKIIRRIQYFTCCPEPYIDVTFYLIIRRRVLYYFLNVIIPCMLLSSLSLTGFLLPPDSGEKVTLGLTVLLAFSVFMLLVAENMPPTSEYIPLIGVYLTVIMAMSAMSVALSVFVLNCHHRGSSMNKPPKAVRVMACAMSRLFCMKLLYIDKDEPADEESSNFVNSLGAYDRQVLINDNPPSPAPNHRSNHNLLHQSQGSPFFQSQMTSSFSAQEVTSSSLDQSTIGEDSCNGSVSANASNRRSGGRGRANSDRKSLMESQILQYLKAVLEVYDRSHGERAAVLQWQEVARVMDKSFFWLFVVITSMTTVFLLLISPITKHVEFPEQ